MATVALLYLNPISTFYGLPDWFQYRVEIKRMTKDVYQLIINSCPNNQTETGGILGGKNSVISEFVFDAGLDSKESGCYYPDTVTLNRCVSDWEQHGIDFYGIAHSHFREHTELSSGDKEYIKDSHYSSYYYPRERQGCLSFKN